MVLYEQNLEPIWHPQLLVVQFVSCFILPEFKCCNIIASFIRYNVWFNLLVWFYGMMKKAQQKYGTICTSTISPITNSQLHCIHPLCLLLHTYYRTWLSFSFFYSISVWNCNAKSAVLSLVRFEISEIIHTCCCYLCLCLLELSLSLIACCTWINDDSYWLKKNNADADGFNKHSNTTVGKLPSSQ